MSIFDLIKNYSRKSEREIHYAALVNNSKSKIKIDYFQCVSSSCVYDDEGPKKIKEELEPRGIPEKVNFGYGLAKRSLERKILSHEMTFVCIYGIFRQFYTYFRQCNSIHMLGIFLA